MKIAVAPAQDMTPSLAGAGFLDYSGLDVDAYRAQRLTALVDLLRHLDLARPPVPDRD